MEAINRSIEFCKNEQKTHPMAMSRSMTSLNASASMRGDLYTGMRRREKLVLAVYQQSSSAG
jgi:hypothetical protein